MNYVPPHERKARAGTDTATDSCRGTCESRLSLELEFRRPIPRLKSGQNKTLVLNPFYVLGSIPPRSLRSRVKENASVVVFCCSFFNY